MPIFGSWDRNPTSPQFIWWGPGHVQHPEHIGLILLQSSLAKIRIPRPSHRNRMLALETDPTDSRPPADRFINSLLLLVLPSQGWLHQGEGMTVAKGKSPSFQGLVCPSTAIVPLMESMVVAMGIPIIYHHSLSVWEHPVCLVSISLRDLIN